MSVGIALTTEIPVTGLLGLARHSDVFSGFGLEIFRIVPVKRHVSDKLEGIVVLGIVFRQISSHGQWTVHDHVESELSHECGVDIHVLLVRIPGTDLGLKDAGCVVHRTTLQARKGKNDRVVGLIA